MSRIALTEADYRRHTLRLRYTPIVSTLLAMLLAVLPIVSAAPLLPDLPFLVLIAWRLLRPELWQAGIALPLGLVHDLVAGHPIGQSVALWTITFLAFDMLDARMLFRDYWMDWFFAALAIAGYTAAGWFVGRLMGAATPLAPMMPVAAAGILTYPIVARIVLALDRWRLAR